MDTEALNMSEEEWFSKVPEIEQDPESLEGHVDTSKDEGSEEELEPPDGDITEEDRDSLASKVLEDILAKVFKEEDVLNVSMFALADGEEAEDDEEEN